MDPKRFKLALGHFLSGVTVVTAGSAAPSDGSGWHGMTASAFVSVSMDPPLVLVAVQKKAHMHTILASDGGRAFAVSVLAAGQDKVSNHYAGWKDPAFTPEIVLDRFRTPVIAGALAWLDLDLEQAVDAGDHTLYIGRIVDLDVADPAPADGLPLAYYRGKYGKFSLA